MPGIGIMVLIGIGVNDAIVKLENVQAKVVNSSQREDGKALVGLCWAKLFFDSSCGNVAAE